MAANYTGPRDTNDFDGMDPDRALRDLAAYKLLGEAFELEDAAGIDGRGWLLQDPLQLIRDRREQLERTQRELDAAVQLARHQGGSWDDIARALGLDTAKAIERHEHGGI